MRADRIQDAGVDFVKCELETALAWANLSQTEERVGEFHAARRALSAAGQGGH
jgi:hypothetical protein